jgi:hypothetical protein
MNNKEIMKISIGNQFDELVKNSSFEADMLYLKTKEDTPKTAKKIA